MELRYPWSGLGSNAALASVMQTQRDSLGCRESEGAGAHRLVASMVSSCFTRSFAALEILGHGSVSKSTLPRSTILKICSSVSPQKGGRPESRMYRMTPAAAQRAVG